MGQGDVLPFRCQLLSVNVHGFYAQNRVCLVHADVDGAEQSRKAPGRIQLFKENERADEHQKAVRQLHGAAEVKDDGSGADGNAGELVDDELRQHIKNRRYLHGKGSLAGFLHRAVYLRGGVVGQVKILDLGDSLHIFQHLGDKPLVGIELPLAECTRRIAYVSQDNYLFDLSVMDNIRMGKKGATDEEVIDAAKKCGCHEFIMGLEKGYQTVCGASGGHLSGGERQRISIARAVLKDAPIVILDEATSYTDPENEAVIQSALAKLVRGKTLLVIAHRLSTIADADQIIVVNHGKIEAAGTQAELLASCPLYQTMWEAHISVKDDGEVVSCSRH